MEQCKCYKKELLELFIGFLEKEGLTCTLSVLTTEVSSLWGPEWIPSKKESKIAEVCKEDKELLPANVKRPRSLCQQENLNPQNFYSKGQIASLPCTQENFSEKRLSESHNRNRADPPLDRNQGFKTSEKIHNIALAPKKTTNVSYSNSLQTTYTAHSKETALHDQGKAFGVTFTKSISKQGHCEELERAQDRTSSTSSDGNKNFQDAISDITQNMKNDPIFQEQLQSVLHGGSLSMGWLSLSGKKSDWRDIKDIPPRITGASSDSVYESQDIPVVLENIDLDAFLGSLHAASNQ